MSQQPQGFNEEEKNNNNVIREALSPKGVQYEIGKSSGLHLNRRGSSLGMRKLNKAIESDNEQDSVDQDSNAVMRDDMNLVDSSSRRENVLIKPFKHDIAPRSSKQFNTKAPRRSNNKRSMNPNRPLRDIEQSQNQREEIDTAAFVEHEDELTFAEKQALGINTQNIAGVGLVSPPPDMFVNEDHPQYLDEDDDQVGTSPINLPDPSSFSDYHENGAEGDPIYTQNLSGQGDLHQRYSIEEENEKRKLEQIYMVAGEEKKTHISAVELYGFFSWNLSALVFIIYLIWAFVPDRILHNFGIYYFPNKYYAIAFPLWFAVTVFTVLQLYVTICMYATPSLESYETLQDKHTILKNPNIEHETQEKHLNIVQGSQNNQRNNYQRPQPHGSTQDVQTEEESKQGLQSQDPNLFQPPGMTQSQSMNSLHDNRLNNVDMSLQSGSTFNRKQPKKSTGPQFSNDKSKIADVFELPITVVNNVLYQQIRQQYNQQSTKKDN